jgi:Zn-dependent peptidase ImmA (M78 family)
MFCDVSPEDFVAATDDCVSRLLWQSGIDRPPVDARRVAEQLGLLVVSNRTSNYRGQFVRLAGCGGAGDSQATIVVGTAERPEREQWAIAHEIGESVAHEIFAQLGVHPDGAPENGREAVANRLASNLLLPRRWFTRDGRAFDWDLFELKDRYPTASHELIVRRMLDMSRPIVITLCDQGRVVWRRGNLGSPPRRLLPEEHDGWQRAHATGLPSDDALDSLSTGLDRVRVWPVHEPEWKREIIRSDIAE